MDISNDALGYVFVADVVFLAVGSTVVLVLALVRAKREERDPEPKDMRAPLTAIVAIAAAIALGVPVLLGILPWPVWVVLVALFGIATYGQATGIQGLRGLGKAARARRELRRRQAN
jgi:fatty acid desaturase